jgi:hypothetical protein
LRCWHFPYISFHGTPGGNKSDIFFLNPHSWCSTNFVEIIAVDGTKSDLYSLKIRLKADSIKSNVCFSILSVFLLNDLENIHKKKIDTL